jgi:hypothetical protein
VLRFADSLINRRDRFMPDSNQLFAQSAPAVLKITSYVQIFMKRTPFTRPRSFNGLYVLELNFVVPDMGLQSDWHSEQNAHNFVDAVC